MTEKLMAEIDAKTAAIEAQTTTVARRGRGQEDRADQARPRPSASASTSRRWAAPTPTTRYVFAEGLPADLRARHLLRRPGHLLDRPEGLRADHARQARLRLRHSGERYHHHEAIVGSGRGRQERLTPISAAEKSTLLAEADSVLVFPNCS